MDYAVLAMRATAAVAGVVTFGAGFSGTAVATPGSIGTDSAHQASGTSAAQPPLTSGEVVPYSSGTAHSLDGNEWSFEMPSMAPATDTADPQDDGFPLFGAGDGFDPTRPSPDYEANPPQCDRDEDRKDGDDDEFDYEYEPDGSGGGCDLPTDCDRFDEGSEEADDVGESDGYDFDDCYGFEADDDDGKDDRGI